MGHDAFYPYDTEAPSGPLEDWMGLPGSPAVSNQVFADLKDAPTTISCFERDVDDALGTMCDAMAPWNFICEPDPAVDWQSILNTAMPYPIPMLTDDTSSTADSPNHPRSPLSDCTLVDLAFPSLAQCGLVPSGGALVDQSVVSPPPAFDGFKFTFECQPMTLTPLSDPSSALPEQYYSYNGHDNCQGQYYWPGQQLPQHEVGAAGAVAPGLTNAAEVNANAFAFTPTDPTSLPPPVQPPSELPQEPVVVPQPKPVGVTQKKRSRADSKSSGGESNDVEVPRPKRKRKQDTTPRFLCPFPGCDSKHSRTHNLKVHYDSVHLGKRPHVCDAPGCPRAFSRKHDLIRHHQSAHTSLGSPRKANGVKGSKGANSGEVKKDRLGA